MSHSNPNNTDQNSVESSIHQLAQSLLSRDPTKFNSCINHNFESQATYKGHGLILSGVSNIKHAASLFNTLDGGRAAVVKREEVSWDSQSTTATIQSIRFLRPPFSPISFALPIKTILRFNSEDVPDVDGSNTKASKLPGESLFVTSFEEQWPIESLIGKIPLVNKLFKTLYIPIFTILVLFISNLVFSIQSKFSTQFHSSKAHDLTSKATRILGPSAKEGFQVGKNETDKLIKRTYSTTEKVFKKPLEIVEFGIQRSFLILNWFLPEKLIQLPWPSLFVENSLPPVRNIKSIQSSSKKEKDYGTDYKSFSSPFEQPEKKSPQQPISKKLEEEKEKEEQIPPSQDDNTNNTWNHEETSGEIDPTHARVVVGPSPDGNEPAKEFSIPEAQKNAEGAKPHYIPSASSNKSGKEKKEKEKNKSGGSIKEKGSNRGSSSSSSSRPKTLFDRIEMPKPSAAETEISLGDNSSTGGNGNENGKRNKETENLDPSSTSTNSSSTITPTSPNTSTSNPPPPTTTGTGTDTGTSSTSSPALTQTSKTLEKSLEKAKEKESLEKVSPENEAAGASTAVAGENKPSGTGTGSQKKKNNKKKSGRGGRGGGKTGQN